MTIWLFGDSFAQMNNNNNPDARSWPELLSSSLNTDIKIFGKNGTSLEYMFHIFNNTVHQFEKNDIVIVCITSFMRKWFFPDRPIITHGYRVNVIRSNPIQYSWLRLLDNEVKAIELYEQHLDNHLRLETNTELFFRVLNYISVDMGIKVVIMNLDENITETWKEKYNRLFYVDGYLADASYGEFCNRSDAPMSNDVRAGHFSYRNHKIIAAKLKNLIVNNESFNLSLDLEKDFITSSNFYNPEFRHIEFMSSKI